MILNNIKVLSYIEVNYVDINHGHACHRAHSELQPKSGGGTALLPVTSQQHI